jgi:hypothetical protein
MTEQEWLMSVKPLEMLDWLESRGPVSSRKMILASCAIWHQYVRHWMLRGGSRVSSVVIASSMAITADGIELAEGVADNGTYTKGDVAHNNGVKSLRDTIFSFPQEEPQKAMANVLREVFGNRFRVVAGVMPLKPIGLTTTMHVIPSGHLPAGTTVFERPLVPPLARSIAEGAYANRIEYGELDPERLLVLWDALEDAGCQSKAIREHLCSPGPHYRGCWAIDLILGKI